MLNTATTRTHEVVRIFDVLTAVIMRITVFWDVTLCSPVEVRPLLSKTYCVFLQGRRVSQGSNEQEAGIKLTEPQSSEYTSRERAKRKHGKHNTLNSYTKKNIFRS
jgi:hypothetical protein